MATPRGKLPLMETMYEAKRDATYVAPKPVREVKVQPKKITSPGYGSALRAEDYAKHKAEQQKQQVKKAPVKRKKIVRNKPNPQPAPQPIKIEQVKPVEMPKVEPIKIELPKVELPKEPIISEEEMKKMMKRSLHAEAYNRIDAKAAKRKEKAERKLEKRLEKAKDAKDVAKAQEKYAKAVAKAERKQETAYEKIDYKDNMKILNKIEKEEQGELNKLLTPDGRVPEGATKEQKLEIGKQHYDVVMAGAAKDAARKQHKENKKRIKGDYDIAKKTAALEAAYTANGKTAPAKETVKEAQTFDRDKANKEYADKLANPNNWKTVEVQKGIPLPEMKDVVQTADDKIIDGGMLPEVVVTGKKPKSDDKIIDGGMLPEVVVTGKKPKDSYNDFKDNATKSYDDFKNNATKSYDDFKNKAKGSVEKLVDPKALEAKKKNPLMKVLGSVEKAQEAANAGKQVTAISGINPLFIAKNNGGRNG